MQRLAVLRWKGGLHVREKKRSASLGGRRTRKELRHKDSREGLPGRRTDLLERLGSLEKSVRQEKFTRAGPKKEGVGYKMARPPTVYGERRQSSKEKEPSGAEGGQRDHQRTYCSRRKR